MFDNNILYKADICVFYVKILKFLVTFKNRCGNNYFDIRFKKKKRKFMLFLLV